MTAYKLVTKLIHAEEEGEKGKAEIYHLALLSLTGIVNKGYAIALDFDGTVCSNFWPHIGVELPETIRKAQRLKTDYGVKLILNTCRAGKPLEHAIAWCEAHGLPCDAYNENLPERIVQYGGDCRKINADEYWDDKGVCVN